jgi:hypothetical protein
MHVTSKTTMRETVHRNVTPSAKGLKEFSLDQGAHFMALVLADEEKDRQQILKPMVSHEMVKLPIYLDDSSQVKLSVEQDEGDPVISVDKNGTVQALQEGKAVLIGEFAGMTDKVQVTVETKENEPPR